ncbi:ABC transporter permease [Leptothoe kymatousa]|uniref:ABC transporter permease n=1 Tax=Leptothoe kymatousa TAU-MAC 1615 TaxID=2364775 RepID=A0ABS5Y9W1_9CYAN|nr:ABC transporter permease [Leptothoe kymatousa TAU-MAC 1615]
MEGGLRPEGRAINLSTIYQGFKSSLRPLGLLGPAGLWLFLLMVLPTILIGELSFVPGLKPGQPILGYGLLNYLRILEPTYLQVLKRSATFATGTTLLCLLLGFPVAYWLALMAPKRWRNLLLVLFILPLWTSSLLRTYAWITLLRPSGVINLVLSTLGLPTQSLMNTPWAVYIGMTYSFLPYMVLILYASLERLDLSLLEAAADLGANPRVAFWRVTVPQTFPGIAAGGLLVFVTSLGDFVVPTLLGGPSSMTISRLIYNQFLGVARNWGFGSALSMVLILMVSAAISLLLKYGDRNPEMYS